ncbi:Oligoribonuclease [Buchnera aphidicola (Neophyllaphis podocarpi)]|uniref:oligoribonuclease n=1 Tax=Buchnera aphidicola TaxID=9 RepID=UPI0031B84E1D
MNEDNLIWIDLEMTGLNPKKHFIIEIATLITDINLNIIAEGPVIPIYQNKKKLKIMDKWNYINHNKSGLINKVKNSLFNELIAEKKTIFFLKKWTKKQKSPMCGNSIGNDRRFLIKYMPKLEKYFKYRSIDVSTIKELMMRWKPSVFNKLNKINNHTALNDIKESIKELKFYKKYFFKI